MTELFEVDANLIHRKKCVGYTGWLEDVWLITAVEGRMWGQGSVKPVGVADSQELALFQASPV